MKRSNYNSGVMLTLGSKIKMIIGIPVLVSKCFTALLMMMLNQIACPSVNFIKWEERAKIRTLILLKPNIYSAPLIFKRRYTFNFIRHSKSAKPKETYNINDYLPPKGKSYSQLNWDFGRKFTPMESPSSNQEHCSSCCS